MNGARGITARRKVLDGIEFKPDEKVLDVGCNMGLLSHYLYDRGCKVTGIDMDESVIISDRILVNILGKKVEFQTLDLDEGKIEEHYDTICLFSVLHHFENIESVAENISQKCDRIILECRLVEYGSKPVDGNWYATSKWVFNSPQELIKFCENIFKGFVFSQDYGKVDRDRNVLVFNKNEILKTI